MPFSFLDLTRRDRTIDSIGTTPLPADAQPTVGAKSDSKLSEQAPPISYANPSALGAPDVKPSSPAAPDVKPSSPGAPDVKVSSPGAPDIKPSSPGAPDVKASSPGAPDVKASSLGAQQEKAEKEQMISPSAPAGDDSNHEMKGDLNPSPPQGEPGPLIRETTDLPPDDEVDALAAWSQNLVE